MENCLEVNRTKMIHLKRDNTCWIRILVVLIRRRGDLHLENVACRCHARVHTGPAEFVVLHKYIHPVNRRKIDIQEVGESTSVKAEKTDMIKTKRKTI